LGSSVLFGGGSTGRGPVPSDTRSRAVAPQPADAIRVETMSTGDVNIFSKAMAHSSQTEM